jgi:hypothetical protein
MSSSDELKQQMKVVLRHQLKFVSHKRIVFLLFVTISALIGTGLAAAAILSRDRWFILLASGCALPLSYFILAFAHERHKERLIRNFLVRAESASTLDIHIIRNFLKTYGARYRTEGAGLAPPEPWPDDSEIQ